jgi:hypothetical protein
MPKDPVVLTAVHFVDEAKGFPSPEEFARELELHRDAIQRIIHDEGLEGLQQRVLEYRSNKITLEQLRSEINASLDPAGEGRVWSHYPDMVVGADPFAIGGSVDARINSILGPASRQWAEQLLQMCVAQDAAPLIQMKVIIYH